MKGDFTRDTYTPLKHFTRVLLQQGRVQIEADWNEQVAVLLHYLETLASDLIGPHGGPADHLGFAIPVPVPDPTKTTLPGLTAKQQQTLADTLNKNSNNFLIGPGRYYVEGVLVESENYTLFNSAISDFQAQPYLSEQENYTLDPKTSYLLYLDVWERYVSALEDGDIREVALNGPDTASRAKLIWQVRPLAFTDSDSDKALVKEAGDIPGWRGDPAQRTTLETSLQEFTDWLDKRLAADNPPGTGQLTAQAKQNTTDFDPCAISPEARYRGLENQLYRVEIHTSGNAMTEGGATFKWSRDNGSVAFPISEIAGSVVTLDLPGNATMVDLNKGEWVEVVDDDAVLYYEGRDNPGLLQVTEFDRDEMKVTLSNSPKLSQTKNAKERHVLLRRWNHKGGKATEGDLTIDTSTGAAKVIEGQGATGWLNLENGVQIQFPAADKGVQARYYRAGDYWLIPARVVTGDVEWPREGGKAQPQLARRTRHYHAPLALLTTTEGQTQATDLRRTIQ